MDTEIEEGDDLVCPICLEWFTVGVCEDEHAAWVRHYAFDCEPAGKLPT